MNEEPKPCPFCGGEVFIEGNDEGGLRAICRTRKCVLVNGKTTSDVLAAWNRLTVLPVLPEGYSSYLMPDHGPTTAMIDAYIDQLAKELAKSGSEAMTRAKAERLIQAALYAAPKPKED